jgi:hypothetical protein
MRKIVTLAATAALVVAFAPPTASARHTLAHRVSALEGKVTTLRRDVRTLRTNVRTLRNQNTALARELACITGGIGVASFGGYLYDPDGAEPATTTPVITSALDVTGPGETPQGYFALIDAACLTGRSGFENFGWSPRLRELRR